jgi:hypothetical protein
MSSKTVNKALVTKEVGGVKTTTTVELEVGVTRKEMYAHVKQLDPSNKIRRMWNGVIGESRVGTLKATSSPFVQAMCKKGGHKEADKVIKDMLVF